MPLGQVNVTYTPPILLTSPKPSAVGPNSTSVSAPHLSNLNKLPSTSQLNKPTKISIGVVIPFAVLVALFLTIFLWHRKRRIKKAAIAAKEQQKAEAERDNIIEGEDGNQPYLQRKAELEAKERQNHELKAQKSIQELDSKVKAQEIPAGSHEHRLAVMRTRQELRGCDHSQELLSQEGNSGIL